MSITPPLGAIVFMLIPFMPMAIMLALTPIERYYRPEIYRDWRC